MPVLDKSNQYVFRLGSDTQHSLRWDGTVWRYEFLAGAVLFDEQSAHSEAEAIEIIESRGLTFDQFRIDNEHAQGYSKEIQEKIAELTKLGIIPCAKHGLTAKNLDNTCEACLNTDYPDDFKGTEG